MLWATSAHSSGGQLHNHIVHGTLDKMLQAAAATAVADTYQAGGGAPPCSSTTYILESRGRSPPPPQWQHLGSGLGGAHLLQQQYHFVRGTSYPANEVYIDEGFAFIYCKLQIAFIWRNLAWFMNSALCVACEGSLQNLHKMLPPRIPPEMQRGRVNLWV